MKNILVCYLYTKFDNIRKINCFLKNYKKYKSGIKHDLIICFKLLDQHDLKIARKALKNIKYIEFIDPCKKNDWDFGSYKRVAKKYYNKDILYLNSHSYPICHDWLKKLCFHKKKNSIIAPTGSHESILESIKLKGKLHKIIRYIRRKRKFSKNFNSFPNPHLRTSSFLINSKHSDKTPNHNLKIYFPNFLYLNLNYENQTNYQFLLLLYHQKLPVKKALLRPHLSH